MKKISMFSKAFDVFKEEGVIALFSRFFNFVFNGLWKRSKVFNHKTREGVFNEIYDTNYWGSDESISGTGSEFLQTELISKELPKVFEIYNIKTFLDAPCGDFQWMKRVIDKYDINYIGADIVKALIENNNEAYSNEKINFIHLDICKDTMPKSDLMLCRDCLFHLSFQDIKSFFIKFIDSNIQYLLLTNHKQSNKKFENLDIQTGDFRMLDLFSSPLNLSSDVIYRFDDFKQPEPPREICLFKRSQIIECLSQWN